MHKAEELVKRVKQTMQLAPSSEIALLIKFMTLTVLLAREAGHHALANRVIKDMEALRQKWIKRSS